MTPDEEGLTNRLVEQRMRNRAIEVLEYLADGDEGLARVGADAWFNRFFDALPDDDDSPMGPWHTWSVFTEAEAKGLGGVHFLMVMASETTPPLVTEEELYEMRWPARVHPLARDVFRLLHDRGYFREDREEDEPSGS